MTIIVPTKGSATSSMLDLWQSRILQQQADKAQAADAAGQAGTKSATGANANATGTAATSTTKPTDTTKPANGGIQVADATEDGSVNKLGDNTLVDLRSTNQSAKQQGQAQAAADSGGAGDDIKSQTIKKLKEMLAKVMAQLDAVRSNDRLPPEEKLQQVNALSAEAMSIQAQILALMAPTTATGNNVNTTA